MADHFLPFLLPECNSARFLASILRQPEPTIAFSLVCLRIEARKKKEMRKKIKKCYLAAELLKF
jgi:hypothetical protein